MEKHIRLLDCTLRDGGHIVQGNFGELVIKNIIERLVEAGIDIIEVGFLWDKLCGKDIARYFSISDVKRILPDNHDRSEFSLMADFIDLDHLEPCDGTIKIIRLSFKRWRLDWGLKTAKILMNKGYKVCINPVNNNVYTDQQYIEVLQKVNELHPYGFSIVDTFGVMRVSDLLHRYYLVENNLSKDITIGFHLHENMGLAYSLAQCIIQNVSSKRNVIIDGSLLGMGRVPGNLCIEQIVDYLNDQHGTDYAIEPIYDAIDDYIAPIKSKHPWGYAIPYALSAKYYLHRTYAEYLAGKNRLRTKDMQRILAQIPSSKAETYDEEYISKLYHDYMNVFYDDKFDKAQLSKELETYSKILIIAPGESIMYSLKTIKKAVDEKTVVISVNFNFEFDGLVSDYIFLTNTKRYDAIKDRKTSNKLIITSNLIKDIEKKDYIVSYNDLVHFSDEYCDDSTLMLVNLLSKIGVKKISFAGFDGRKNGVISFFNQSFNRNEIKPTTETNIKMILNSNFKDISKEFITKSEYKGESYV